MKKALLASTAIVGAALLSAPAQAGTLGTGDNLEVTFSGFMWFQGHWLDEDVSENYGRGYDFDIPETEVHFNARNTADNGITYGVSVEMEVNTDATNNGDEVWAFLDGDFGRVELGDQDDATNRMLVGAFQAHKGLSGPFGALGGVAPVFHFFNSAGSGAATAAGGSAPRFLWATDWQAATSSDATKAIYFSPRFSGFQVGASYTVDTGGNGASFGEKDNNGSYEDVIGLGANFTDKFGDFGVSASVLYETSDVESNGTKEDLEVLFVGGKVDYAGFTFGANYTDFGDSANTTAQTAAGAGDGQYYAVAVGYQQGPWGISGWYSNGEVDNTSSDEDEIERYGVGGRYAIAPGWQIRADYNANDLDLGGSSSDSQAFILTNMINF
jgi:hypothetical protein